MSTTNSNVPLPPNGRQLDCMEKAKLPSDQGGRKRTLRIAVVTENFLPKVDGVTRTLARLLEHLQMEGHEALVLGPESGMTSYAGHEVVGTKGIPLLGVYKGLKLNFIRPLFIRRLVDFKPDVIQFVDPIWLCAQCIPAIQYWLPDTPLLASYHTNLASYATLYGFSWLTPTMWNLQRNLHARCSLTYCPSPSTARMLTEQGFNNVRLWPRGVDTTIFRPTARDPTLRISWSADLPLAESRLSPRLLPVDPARRPSLDFVLGPAATSPPAYSFRAATPYDTGSKVVMLYVGRISWEKNLRLLVEAFRGLEVASVDGARPACQLVFVGDGPARVELEALCASYGLGAVFMGYRKGEELAAAYASADIFAFPSWTETFGQVVLESLASGLPVVGLRAEGVCDLVKHEQTGLLLDLDDLLPTTSAESIKTDLPSYDEKTPAFRPLPANPHALVDISSPTFPLATSLYRSLLVDLATNHDRRRAMGQAAAIDASSRSWHGAMEMLVDGYREIARPAPPPPSLGLSRTSTIEFDIVSHLAESDTYAESTAAAPKGRRGVGRVLRLGGVFKRTGGRLKEGSMSVPGNFLWRRGGDAKPVRSWLGRKEGMSVGETVEGVQLAVQSNQVWATKWVIRLAILSYLFYLVSVWVMGIEGGPLAVHSALLAV